jgi:hypothetical protein
MISQYRLNGPPNHSVAFTGMGYYANIATVLECLPDVAFVEIDEGVATNTALHYLTKRIPQGFY